MFILSPGKYARAFLLMRTLLLVLLLLGAAASLQAQSPLPASRYLEIGVSGNHYRGDLQGGTTQFKPGLHLGLKFNKASRLNGNLSLSLAQVEGQDPAFFPDTEPNIRPNRYVSTSFFAANYLLQYNLIKKERYQLYIGQGIGLFRYNPKDEQDRPLQDQRSTRLPNEEYGNISLMLPTAAGLIYFLPNQWGLGFQASLLNPLTDYLDNISELGPKKCNDNVLQFRLQLLVPLKEAVRAK
jgi:hypothetical protein